MAKYTMVDLHLVNPTSHDLLKVTTWKDGRTTFTPPNILHVKFDPCITMLHGPKMMGKMIGLPCEVAYVTKTEETLPLIQTAKELKDKWLPRKPSDKPEQLISLRVTSNRLVNNVIKKHKYKWW